MALSNSVDNSTLTLFAAFMFTNVQFLSVQLPIEIIKEIFEYLPIPNEELFGKGDGGAQKWKNLKSLTFEILNTPREEGLFQQFEYNEYHKCIQFQHLSVRSLIDCYFRPPFFPDGLELRVGVSDFKSLMTYDFMLEKFRIRPDNEGTVDILELSRNLKRQFSLIETDDLDLLSDIQFKSLNIRRSIDLTQLFQIPLKELIIDEDQWDSLLEGPLSRSLEKLTLRVNNGRVAKEHLLLSLDFPKLKLFNLSCRALCKTAEVILPSNLEEFVIEGQLLECKMNFPPGIQIIHLGHGETNLIETHSLETSDKLFKSFACSLHFPSLRSLSVGSSVNILVEDLPLTLESLTMRSLVLEGNLNKLPNLTKVSILSTKLDVVFQNYKVNLPLPNSFSFKIHSQTYSVRFSDQLKSLFLSNSNVTLVLSYPESLKTLDIRNCGPEMAKRWPPNLKGLRILYNHRHTEKVVLPESLEVFHLLFDLIENYQFRSIKHLYQSKFHFETFNPPDNLRSWVFAGNISSNEGIFDLSHTKVSRIQYATTGRIDNTEIILPPSLRRLETNKRHIMNDVRVSQKLCRDVSIDY